MGHQAEISQFDVYVTAAGFSFNGVQQGSAFLRVPDHQGQIRPGFGKGDAGGEPQAAAGTGDHYMLAIQVLADGLPLGQAALEAPTGKHGDPGYHPAVRPLRAR